MKTKRDEALEEIWAIRRKLARRFNYDPKKAAAYYQRKQKELSVKIYQREEPAGAGVHAYAALHDRAQAEIAAGSCAALTSYGASRKRKAKRAK